jgi:hypothetical protein
MARNCRLCRNYPRHFVLPLYSNCRDKIEALPRTTLNINLELFWLFWIHNTCRVSGYEMNQTLVSTARLIINSNKNPSNVNYFVFFHRLIFRHVFLHESSWKNIYLTHIAKAKVVNAIKCTLSPFGSGLVLIFYVLI